jgi:S-DNA-T family DNA segregation ATPase FtsK/SpoIIIE
MLIFHNSEMVRVQCAFIDTPEVEEICEYVERQPYPTGPYMLPEPAMDNGEGGSNGSAASLSDRDVLFEEVARSIVNAGTASTSSVQRHYGVGYVRAGKIMDQLEAAGIVGPSQGGKPRAVLVDTMSLEDILRTLE